MSIKRDILWRVGLVYLAIAIFAALIIIKIVFIQFIDDDRWKTLAEKTQYVDKKIASMRGDIYSDDMRLLASSIPYYEIRIDLLTKSMTEELFEENVGSLASSLARLINNRNDPRYRTEAEYIEMMKNARSHNNQYLKLVPKVTYNELKELYQFPVFKIPAFKLGLIEEPIYEREKPFGVLASRVIGYKNNGPNGEKIGLEAAFDEYLQGVEGVRKMQKVPEGDPIPVREAGQIEPHDGSSIVSTINIEMQDIAHKALAKQIDYFRAAGGTAVVMEVPTGDIKAMVNLSRVDTTDELIESYNHAVLARTEPGSTFKVAAMMVALEEGYVTADKVISTGNGIFVYYGDTITDWNWEEGGNGDISAKGVIEMSSNIGMTKIITGAYANQPEQFFKGLYRMGLNKPLGITIEPEPDPVFHYPEQNKRVDPTLLSTMSYGYSLALSPLQTLTFYNAIANDGVMVKPRFATEVRYRGEREKIFPVEVLNSGICSSRTIKVIQEMLEGVVTDGIVKKHNTSLLRVAGKTGTNRMYIPNVGYDKKKPQTSFVGYFPADNPKYSCIVMVYSPRGDNASGTNVAAPAFFEIAKKVYLKDYSLQPSINEQEPGAPEIPYSKNGHQMEITRVLDYLRIRYESNSPDSVWVATEKMDDHIELYPASLKNGVVPNVLSMGLKDAVYLLESMGLDVRVVGRGRVLEQSPLPGTKFIDGQVIELKMSNVKG